MPDIIDPRIDIRGPRLSLRALRPLDAPALARLANNANVVRYLSRVPFPYQRQHAEEFVTHCQTAWQDGSALNFGIHRLDNKQLVGVIGLDADQTQKGGWALGYWLGEAHWHQGYVSEAINLLLPHLKLRPAFSVIRALVHPDNRNSTRILEKSGFHLLESERRSFFPHLRDWAFCPVWQLVL